MKKTINKKVMTGLVVSNKMDKTVVVSVATRKLHPLYKKYLTSTKKYKVHDEENSANEGDTVSIMECRPLSRDKRWNLDKIVERAK